LPAQAKVYNSGIRAKLFLPSSSTTLKPKTPPLLIYIANQDAPGTHFNVLSETVSKQGSMLQQINTHMIDIQQ